MKNLYPEKKFSSYTKVDEKSKLNCPQLSYLHLEVSSCNFSFVVLTVLCVFFVSVSMAQSGINNFTTVNNSPSASRTYTGPGIGIAAQAEYIPQSRNTFSYNFGSSSGYSSGLMAVNGYTTRNASFSVITNIITSVVMRRVNNSVVTGTRDILFFAGNRTPSINSSNQTNSNLRLNLNAEYVSNMSQAFSQNNLLIGTDNMFSNQGNANGNNNNIERVDVMISGGYQVPNAYKYGFPILERGVYGVHDAFKIAVITALDSYGNPSAYSNVVSVISSNYNNTSTTNPVSDGTYIYFLFKRDGASDLQVDQHMNDQGLGGVAFRFSDFGLTSGATIYGYSIMSNDFNSASGADVVDYTNAARYPTNTSETVGGLDLLAVMGIAMDMTILPIQMSAFTASEKAGKSLLEWTTLTEMNNRGFQVERSANGRDWVKIGFVSSNAPEGNSAQKLQYSYLDNKPSNGINYYRLIQYDLDSHEKTSETRIVAIGGNDSKVIKTFPNPAVNTIYVQGIEPGTNLRLTDIRGAIVSQTTATASIEAIPVYKLNSGIYFLQVISKGVLVKAMKVVKM